MKCAGPELSLGECEFKLADDACLSHVSDAVLFCGANGVLPFMGRKFCLFGEGWGRFVPYSKGVSEAVLRLNEAAQNASWFLRRARFL